MALIVMKQVVILLPSNMKERRQKIGVDTIAQVKLEQSSYHIRLWSMEAIWVGKKRCLEYRRIALIGSHTCRLLSLMKTHMIKRR